MAIKLTSSAGGTVGTLGIGSATALTIDSNNSVTVANSISAAALSGSLSYDIISVAALNIDCSLGTYFTKTINGNSTFTVSNVPSGRAYSFTLELTHTSGTVTWFSGVVWPGGIAPVLTTGKVHLFTFITDDGGTTWRGAALVNYAS